MDRRRGSGQGVPCFQEGQVCPQLAVEGWRVTRWSQGLGRWVKQEEGGAALL